MSLIPVHHGRHERRKWRRQAWRAFWAGPFATYTFVTGLMVVFTVVLGAVLVVMPG